VACYREQHGQSGGKSDPEDSTHRVVVLTRQRLHRQRVLADLLQPPMQAPIGPQNAGQQFEYTTTGFVDWYNNRRGHGSIGTTPPVESSKPNTLPSRSRCSPHESGTKP
jgi:hypothetical protein